jgi:hypothetical protein
VLGGTSAGMSVGTADTSVCATSKNDVSVTSAASVSLWWTNLAVANHSIKIINTKAILHLENL